MNAPEISGLRNGSIQNGRGNSQWIWTSAKIGAVNPINKDDSMYCRDVICNQILVFCNDIELTGIGTKK